MIRMKRLKYVPGALFTIAVIAANIQGCSAAKDAAAGCDGLDVNVTAQATVKAYSEAAVRLRAAAQGLEAKFLTVCNDMNRDLGEDATKTTAAEACGILHARVQRAAAAGVTVETQIAFNCRADVSAQANCEASCTVPSCDVRAQCTGGDVVVACNGACDAACDVQAPDFQCSGTCQGTCTATAAVACSGSCEGTCDAPTFEGSCDAGCSASFVGTCDGTCDGMCDGATSTGAACKGKCQGTCTGKATGTCQARCMGNFKGGQCMGMCTGSCSADAAISCSGKCNGKCTYTPGSATCSGSCHGMCTGSVTPPRCTGMLSCMGSAECHSNCQAQANATIDCSRPQATVTVVGDVDLQRALEAHIQAWGEAINLTLALKTPIADVAGKTVATLQAVGDIGVAGIACVGSTVSAFADVQASFSVSFTASASLSASSM